MQKESAAKTEYDLVIIGNGAAAFAAAIKADELRKKAALIQGGVIGGTCVNVGCVPSKRMLTAGELIKSTSGHDLGRRTIKAHTENFNFQNLLKSKDQMVSALRREKYGDVLKGLSKNVHVYMGKGVFVSKDQVRLASMKDGSNSNTTVTGKSFLIATGSRPRIPAIEGIEEIGYWTNVEALSPPYRPRSLIVIGGRALGLEFAQMYSRLGSKVTLLQRSNTIIPNEEPEIAKALTNYLVEDGIQIVTNVDIRKVSRSVSKVQTRRKTTKATIIEVEVDRKTARFRAEAILLATGRAPNSNGIGLEEIGVNTREDGGIIIDDEMRTSIPNLFAAGDVTGEPMLEALAAREGTKAAENALTGSNKKIDVGIVPKAIFTDPQFASVGLTEREAIERGYECNCRVLNFSDVAKARIIGNTRGVIKMVLDNKTLTVIGIHILCPNAADLITEAALIIKNKYIVEDVIDTIHVFPTLSEAIKIIAQSFFRDPGTTSCCI